MDSPKHLSIVQLEEALEKEKAKYDDLKKVVDSCKKNKVIREKKMVNERRESEYYEDKVKHFTICHKDLERRIKEVLDKRERLKQLEKSLEEFKDVEPTNEALKRKIDDLKKKRMSLDMTFVDDSLE